MIAFSYSITASCSDPFYLMHPFRHITRSSGSLLSSGPALPSSACRRRSLRPFRTCRAESDPEVCRRGWGVWSKESQCCARGAAHQDGCSTAYKQCWVAENHRLRTCIRDDRRCLQGAMYGMEAMIWGRRRPRV